MTWYSDMLTQIATYWAPALDENGNPVLDDFGNITFASPVQVSCRWEDTNELIRDANGNEIVSEARVFLDQEVKIEGYLYLGISNETSPVNDAKEIRKFNKTPDIEGKEYEYKVWL